ncbi:MAG TPA: hypothetical protein VNC78_02200 [Actinomycetota bacterium]|nr:hypothetical protein [Actinomycetota bacterium]
MIKRSMTVVALGLLTVLVFANVAYADFTPVFTLETSNTVINGNPEVKIHMEFDEEDEEIGNFKMTIPKGFIIAGDDQIPEVPASPPAPLGKEGEEIGSGTITIEGGLACRPGPEGGIPLSTAVNIDATLYERTRTDDEIDAGVHAVWFLDIEPLNRVRLLVKGSPLTGWTVEGAPTPSDNTCNPLVVDITINAQSESGVPLITNRPKPGKVTFLAEIASQDSPTVAMFTHQVVLTKV